MFQRALHQAIVRHHVVIVDHNSLKVNAARQPIDSLGYNYNYNRQNSINPDKITELQAAMGVRPTS